MDRLGKLPVFLDLDGKRALIAGHGAGVAWKARLLAAAGADVAVFAPHAEKAVEAGPAPSRITLYRRGWTPADFAGVTLALLEPEGEGEIRRFRHHAKAAGALVNIIDTPAFCDFQFGTIVNRSPAIIGISTDGAAPILAQALRRRIEAILPRDLGAWTMAARRFRDRVATALPERADRRLFWERFVDRVFARGDSGGDRGAALDAILRTLRQGEASTPAETEIRRIAADPRDPEGLTLGMVRDLQAADIILHDVAFGPEILNLGRREARLVPFRSEAGEPPPDIRAEPGRRIVALTVAVAGRKAAAGDTAFLSRGPASTNAASHFGHA